jgi:hypothetical protein
VAWGSRAAAHHGRALHAAAGSRRGGKRDVEKGRHGRIEPIGIGHGRIARPA